MAATEERKLVTVLFADLAGSTEMAVRLDPEALRALLSAFFQEMAQQIRAFGGTVEKYAGDAILAVFGVPDVHEDDAERAVRAALSMQQSLDELNPSLEEEHGTRLALRVGVATEEAVAATQAAGEFMVSGPVAFLAARLQQLALGIVVSAETQAMLGPLLECSPLGPVALKGFPEPVTAYLVSGLRAGSARARATVGVSASLIGREAELEILERRLAELQLGRGSIVSIAGEAGIGKSRLASELRGKLPEGVRWVEARCDSYASDYAPFIQVLRSLLHLRGGEPATVARTRLRAALQPLVGERYEELQPFVARLLGVELAGAPGAIDPRAFQSHLLLTVRALVEAVAARSPLVLAFEDIHWADEPSLELLGVLLEVTDFAPVMILLTRRDEEAGGAELALRAQRNYPHRWTEVRLGPLDVTSSQRLTEDLLRGSEPPSALARRIREHGEGNR